MTIGERIRHYRELVEMTQDQLAERLGVTASAISLIESDKRGINLEKLYKICDALGITIADIINE
jgi:transcriptional regulator with XRE-family HTH domain